MVECQLPKLKVVGSTPITRFFPPSLGRNTQNMSTSESKGGLLFALGAYLMWGVFPIYWKFLIDVPALNILAHRMVWSLAFLLILLTIRTRWSWISKLNRKVVFAYFGASLFLAANWGTYIWAVNAGFVVETALGYFINPLINVVFGALVLGERPRKGQWIAILLAASGVFHLAFLYGQVPWIALILASTFGLYGLIKKMSPLGALESVTLESALLFIPALGFIIWSEMEHSYFLEGDGLTQTLLALSGVATMLPLLCFAAAVRRLTLTVLGVMQYIAPTLQFLIGVLLYNEPMDATRLVGFILIWTALAVFSVEGVMTKRARSSTR